MALHAFHSSAPGALRVSSSSKTLLRVDQGRARLLATQMQHPRVSISRTPYDLMQNEPHSLLLRLNSAKRQVVCSAAAAGTSGKGTSSSSALQSTAYVLLAASVAAQAAALILAPQQCAEAAFNATPLEPLKRLLQFVGVSILPLAVSLFTLKGAADHGRLSSATYQRQNLFLSAAALYVPTIAAMYFREAGATWNNVWMACAIQLALLFIATTVPYLQAVQKQLAMSSAPPEVDQVMTGPQKVIDSALGYTVMLVALGYSALSLLVGHHEALLQPQGLLPTLLWRLIAGALLFASMFAYTLKDAAERGRLGASTFKALQLGLGALGLGLLGLIWGLPPTTPLPGGLGLSAFLAFIAGQSLYEYVTVKK